MSASQLIEMNPIESFDSFIELLRAEGLPHSDLMEPGREFWQFKQDGEVVGYAGSEGTTGNRLLRSLVLSPSHRGKGYGSAALRILERHLATKGVKTLHLLTSTAEPFFQVQGFVILPRPSAPATIQQSLEFRQLCPSSATYLAKKLI